MAETCTPVRPKGFFGTSPDGTDWGGVVCWARADAGIMAEAPTIAALFTKLRRLRSSRESILALLKLFFWKWMTSIHGRTQHVLYFTLLGVEGKTVSQARLGIIKLQRQLVEFESAVGGFGLADIAERVHFRFRERREVLSDLQVLLEDVHTVRPGDGGGYGKAHRVTYCFLGRDDTFLNSVTVAVQRFHAERRNAALVQFGQDLALEASEICIEGVEWHLNGVEGKSSFQHSQMYLRILVSGESDEANLAIFFRLLQCFGR